MAVPLGPAPCVSVAEAGPDGVPVGVTVAVGDGVSDDDGVVLLTLGVGFLVGFLVCVGDGVGLGVVVCAGMTMTRGGGGGRTRR